MSGHSERSVFNLLREKYRDPEWGIVSQVRNSTGFVRGLRTADALAMSLWPSNGLHLHGFEIKVSRSDWVKELQDITKATAFEKHCNFWWIVAPQDVVKLEELPATWGLQEITKSNSLRVKRPATMTPAEPFDVNLLAGLFRAISRAARDNDEVFQAEQRGREEGITIGEERAKRDSGNNINTLERVNEKLLAKLDAAQKALGTHFWSVRDIERAGKTYKIGKAFEGVLNVGDRIDHLIASLSESKALLADIAGHSTLIETDPEGLE